MRLKCVARWTGDGGDQRLAQLMTGIVCWGVEGRPLQTKNRWKSTLFQKCELNFFLTCDRKYAFAKLLPLQMPRKSAVFWSKRKHLIRNPSYTNSRNVEFAKTTLYNKCTFILRLLQSVVLAKCIFFESALFLKCIFMKVSKKHTFAKQNYTFFFLFC